MMFYVEYSFFICFSLLFIAIDGQYSNTSNDYIEGMAMGRDALQEELELHPDAIAEFHPERIGINRDIYVEDYPNSAKYRINVLLDPCRLNSYDCCLDVFGTPEYPALLRAAREQERVYQYVVLGNDSEVQKNYYYVYEDGSPVPIAAQRSPDDFKVFTEKCKGLNNPTSDCKALNYQFERSTLRPPCVDNNYSINSLTPCYYPNGTQADFPCVQVAYFSNTMIPQCSVNDHCGTYLEIHMAHGTAYLPQDEIIAEALIDDEYTTGYSTTVLPLIWRGNHSKVLCSYSEGVLRIGSLVYIQPTAPVCCCPQPFSPDTRVGSFHCPRGATAEGPYAYRDKTLADTIMTESVNYNYPFCHADLSSDKDTVMCSFYDVHDRRHYTKICPNVTHTDPKVIRSWTSSQMRGLYDGPCPYYQNCALNTDEPIRCKFTDYRFTFIGRVGIVTALDNEAAIPQVWVTFNDNRTSYQFRQDDVILETRSKSMYEIWWVVRSASKFTIQKKKSFNVTTPSCTYDLTNDRYFPYAMLDGMGNPVPNAIFP